MKLHNKPREDTPFLKGDKTYRYIKAPYPVGGWFVDSQHSRFHIDMDGVVESFSRNGGGWWTKIYNDSNQSFDNALAWLAASLLTGAIK